MELFTHWVQSLVLNIFLRGWCQVANSDGLQRSSRTQNC